MRYLRKKSPTYLTLPDLPATLVSVSQCVQQQQLPRCDEHYSATEAVRDAKAQRDERMKPVPLPAAPRQSPQQGDGAAATAGGLKDPTYQQAKRQRRWERKQARLRLDAAQKALVAAEGEWEGRVALLALALEGLGDLVAGDGEEEEQEEGEVEEMYDSDQDEARMEAEAEELLQQNTSSLKAEPASPLFPLLLASGALRQASEVATALSACLLRAHAEVVARAARSGQEPQQQQQPQQLTYVYSFAYVCLDDVTSPHTFLLTLLIYTSIPHTQPQRPAHSPGPPRPSAAAVRPPRARDADGADAAGPVGR